VNPDRHRLRVLTSVFRAHRFRKFAWGLFCGSAASNVTALRALFKSEQKNFFDSAYSIQIGWRNIFGRHGRLLLAASYFRVFSMVLIRLKEFLCRAGWVISGSLLLDFPATIFAYSGFFPRLANVADTIAIGFACTAVGCLSWFAGRTLQYVLAHRARSHLARCAARITAAASVPFAEPHQVTGRGLSICVHNVEVRNGRYGRVSNCRSHRIVCSYRGSSVALQDNSAIRFRSVQWLCACV